MDVYVHDTNFLELSLFDAYKSMLWTERYSGSSECIFEIPESAETRRLLKEGNFLSIPESDEVIQIDTFSVKDKIITVSGTALDTFLDQRFVKPSWDNRLANISVVGFPQDFPGYLVNEFAALPSGIMGSGGVTDAANGPYEVIPNLEVATPDIQNLDLYESQTFPIEVGTLYAAVKKICDTFGLGFKLIPVDISAAGYRLIFQVYEGRDRTSLQTLNEVVQFNSALDMLTNTTELRSMKGYKNVAWAYATNIPYTAPLVGRAFAKAGDQYKVGFDRRVLYVDVSDIQAADVDLTTSGGRAAFVSLLNQRARTALANNNYVRLVDGELVPQSGIEYKVNYGLGDIIELTIDTGDSNYARVTEYIYSQDDTGFKSYPTLSAIN